MLVISGYDGTKRNNTTDSTFRSKFLSPSTISLISKQQHVNLVPLPHGLTYGVNFLPHILVLNPRESSLEAAQRPCSFVCRPCVSLNRGQRWWCKQSGPGWTEITPDTAAEEQLTWQADCRCFGWRCCRLKCCCEASSSQIESVIIGCGFAGGDKDRSCWQDTHTHTHDLTPRVRKTHESNFILHTHERRLWVSFWWLELREQTNIL